MTEEPISAWTALAYPVAAGGVLYLEPTLASAVFVGAMILLAVGTFAFHWDFNPATVDLDHAGMNAALGAVCVHAAGGPWWTVLLAALGGAVVLEYLLKVPNRHLMGVFVFVALAALAGAGAWWMMAVSVFFLALAFVAWHRDGDAAHGFWHVSSAVGLAILFLAA